MIEIQPQRVTLAVAEDVFYQVKIVSGAADDDLGAGRTHDDGSVFIDDGDARIERQVDRADGDMKTRQVYRHAQRTRDFPFLIAYGNAQHRHPASSQLTDDRFAD